MATTKIYVLQHAMPFNRYSRKTANNNKSTKENCPMKYKTLLLLPFFVVAAGAVAAAASFGRFVLHFSAGRTIAALCVSNWVFLCAMQMPMLPKILEINVRIVIKIMSKPFFLVFQMVSCMDCYCRFVYWFHCRDFFFFFFCFFRPTSSSSSSFLFLHLRRCIHRVRKTFDATLVYSHIAVTIILRGTKRKERQKRWRRKVSCLA